MNAESEAAVFDPDDVIDDAALAWGQKLLDPTAAGESPAALDDRAAQDGSPEFLRRHIRTLEAIIADNRRILDHSYKRIESLTRQVGQLEDTLDRLRPQFDWPKLCEALLADRPARHPPSLVRQYLHKANGGVLTNADRDWLRAEARHLTAPVRGRLLLRPSAQEQAARAHGQPSSTARGDQAGSSCRTGP